MTDSGERDGDPAHSERRVPAAGTIERWAYEFVVTTDAQGKLEPPVRPVAWEDLPKPRAWVRPGRPAKWRVLTKAPRSLKTSELRVDRRRAQQMHVFLHHELQAAELMAWALLAFPATPRAFRSGLLSILDDENRHLQMYRAQLRRLGFEAGDFPVRDWFWERVPLACSPLHFVAVMGIGLEGGNLDHARRFAERFRAIGDEEAARVQEAVERDEVAHVRFAMHWYRELRGASDAAERTGSVPFDEWRAHLPEPLSPQLMRGRPLNVAERRRAGFSAEFLRELEKW